MSSQHSDEDIDEQMVILATQKMGSITPNDKRFYRLLTEKANNIHSQRVKTASTRKIRRKTVKEIYQSLLKEGKVSKTPVSTGSMTSANNKSSHAGSIRSAKSSSSSSSASTSSTNSTSTRTSFSSSSSSSSSSSKMGPPTSKTPGNLLASPSARSAKISQRKRSREPAPLHSTTPGSSTTTPALKRPATEPYVRPANLPALRTVVGLCRKRLSDCNYNLVTKDVVGLTKQQGELQELLERTLLESENNSVLLIGARGSGKSLLTEHVLKIANEKYKRIENEQGETRTTKRKRTNKTSTKTSSETTLVPSSQSQFRSNFNSTSTSSTSSASSFSSSIPNKSSKKQKSKRKRTGPRDKSLVTKPQVLVVFNDPTNITQEERSFVNNTLMSSLKKCMKRVHNTRSRCSHIVLLNERPKLSVELAFVFVQCRESLYDGNVASHVVTKDWLVDSNESKYPIQESNYSFLSACQRRQKKMLSVSKKNSEIYQIDDEEDDHQHHGDTMLQSLDAIERSLDVNLNDVFMVTEDDDKKLPLESTLVFISPELSRTCKTDQLKLLITSSGGEFITKLPIGKMFNQRNETAPPLSSSSLSSSSSSSLSSSLSSPASLASLATTSVLPYNTQIKKNLMIVGTKKDIEKNEMTDDNNTLPAKLSSIGITHLYTMDSLLRVVLTGDLVLNHSIDQYGKHHQHHESSKNNQNMTTTNKKKKNSFFSSSFSSSSSVSSSSSSVSSSSSSSFSFQYNNSPESPSINALALHNRSDSSSSLGSNSPYSPNSSNHSPNASNASNSPFSPDQPSLSAYELARLEQIRENEAALRALGIIGARLGGGPTDLEKEEEARRAREKKQDNLMVRELRKERQRRQKVQEEAKKSPFMVVRLNGVMHSDESGEKRALEEISRQMFQDVRLTFSNRISFAQHLRFLFDMLREMKGLDSALVFILDEFDAFAVSHKKQMLLYTLLDLQQSGEVKMLVIGLTERLDIADKLEKRVKSRFSHRQIYVPPLSFNNLLKVMKESLTLSKKDVVSNNSFNNLKTNKNLKSTKASKGSKTLKGSKTSKGSQQNGTLTAGVRGKWNSSIDTLFQHREIKKIIKRYHDLGHSTRWFFQMLSHAISNLLSPSRINNTKNFSVLTNYDITSALASSPASIDRGAQLFKGLTVAELLLIIAMCSVEKKTGSSGSYNFHMAYGELLSLFSLEDDFGAASGMQYRYDKKIFYKAFEHLVMLGVVQPVGQHVAHRFLSRSSLLASRDAQPSDCIVGDQALRVVLPRRQVQELIREIDRKKTIPTIVTRFAGKWL